VAKCLGLLEIFISCPNFKANSQVAKMAMMLVFKGTLFIAFIDVFSRAF
jgi:hypothetical protein